MVPWDIFAKLIKEPFLIFLMCPYALLGWIIWQLLKTIANQVKYERELVAELSQTSKTLVRLATLVETLMRNGAPGP